MITNIINLEQICFSEDVAEEATVDKYMPIFHAYRNQWKDYNRAKKAKQTPSLPVFPFDTIRAYEVESVYFPRDVAVSTILYAAQKARIKRLIVIVEEVVVDRDGFSLEKPPIHANRFFADYQRSIRQLQGNDSQRIRFFQPLLRTMIVEGFTDNSCQTEFMNWARKEFDRYPPVKSTTTGPAPKTRTEPPPILAGAFFDDFPSALKRLQATDQQRIELFKPLLRMILNEGFTDKSYRARFMFWAKREFDRISSDE